MYSPPKPGYHLIHYLLFFSCIGCGEKKFPEPLPDLATRQENATVPLADPWLETLRNTPDSDGKKYFEDSLKQLSKSERGEILAILQVIKDPTQQQRFLQIFMGFHQEEQSRLFRILLYLVNRDRNLLYKLVDPDQELTIFEKVQMWQNISELPAPDEQLIKRFKEQLDNSS